MTSRLRLLSGTLASAALALGVSSIAGAQDFGSASSAVAESQLEVKLYNDTPYVSGGVGEGERQLLNSMSKRFNLKLVFANKSGHFLSDVRVLIEDRSRNTVLEAVSDGPLFYAELPPGRYTVVAEGFGRSMTRTVQVPPGRQTQLDFYWQ